MKDYVGEFAKLQRHEDKSNSIYDNLDKWEGRKHDIIVAAMSNGGTYEEAEEICNKLGYNQRIANIRDTIDRHTQRLREWSELALKETSK